METDYLTGSSSFRMAHRYANLTAVPSLVAHESGIRDRNDPPSERHLRCVWADPSLRPQALHTLEGEPVRVEDPGRWNLEAGPDFLDAILAIGHKARRVVGDVEVHLRPADWQHHGHSSDPAYAKVVCHLTYWSGRLPDGVLPPGATHIALRGALAAMPGFSFESIDVDAFPYATLTAERPPCAEALAAMPGGARMALLDAAGQERLRAKAARMATAISEVGPDQALYEEWMVALGFKNNRSAFRHLAHAIPVQELRDISEGDVLTAYAILLGVAGLIPRQCTPDREDESVGFIRRMWTAWWKRESRFEKRMLPRNLWRLSGCRPLNHPTRRLAGAADLFVRQLSLTDQILSIDTRNPIVWRDALHDIMEASVAMEFVLHRQGLASRRRPQAIALIGAEREAAIAANVVLPFLAACGKSVEPLFAALAIEANNAVIRETAHALFGRDHSPSLYRTGLRQQGLIQIAQDFCLDRRTGCAGCRLPAAIGRWPGTLNFTPV
jgi:hypothetical protein